MNKIPRTGKSALMFHSIHIEFFYFYFLAFLRWIALCIGVIWVLSYITVILIRQKYKGYLIIHFQIDIFILGLLHTRLPLIRSKSDQQLDEAAVLTVRVCA